MLEIFYLKQISRERERVVDGGSERLTSTELYTKHERKKRFLLVANTFMFGSVK